MMCIVSSFLPHKQSDQKSSRFNKYLGSYAVNCEDSQRSGVTQGPLQSKQGDTMLAPKHWLSSRFTAHEPMKYLLDLLEC